MLKLFFLYALIAGIIMTFYAFVNIKGELEAGIEEIKKEYEVTNEQIYTVFFVLLMVLGWAFLPYMIVKAVIGLMLRDRV